MARIRTQPIYGTSGDRTVYGGYWPSEPYLVSRKTCEDFPQTRRNRVDGLALDIWKEEWKGGRLFEGGGPADWFYHNGTVCEAVRYRSGHLMQALELLDAPGDVTVATHVTASTNPSRAEVDIATFLGELKDIPGLLQQEGNAIYRRRRRLNDAADLHLTYQFGIAPLVADLNRFLEFQSSVNNRIRQIRGLKARGQKSTIQAGTFESSGTRYVNLNSHGLSWSDWCQVTTTQRVWGHIKWHWDPFADFPPEGSDGLRRLAARAAGGLTVDFATAWNLIPWSWLIDWTSNVGTYLAASRNIVPAIASPVQVMRHTVNTVTAPGWTYTSPERNCVCEPIEVRWESKTRRLVNAGFEANLPFISARQASILGAIGVRSRRNGLDWDQR